MSFHLRARNTATAESQADVLEELELEAGRNVPSPDHNEPNVTKKRSTNIDKFFESDGRLLEPRPPAPSLFSLSSKDKRAMALLVVLYILQGTAVGMTSGSTPVLLGARLSHNQALAGVTLWLFGTHLNGLTYIPLIFTSIIFTATQDIALHGWALELLSRGSLPYASTAQTVGIYIGYFLSFTVFVAQKGPEFSNSRWRRLFESLTQDYRMVILSGYLKFGSVCYILVTLYLSFLPNDDSVDKDSPESNNLNVKKVYRIMYEICKLKHVQRLILLHFIVNVGVSVNDIATSSELLEKGGAVETTPSAGKSWIWALLVQVPSAYGVVDWSTSSLRLNRSPNSYLILVIASMAMSGLASTVQFVGISAFHAQVRNRPPHWGNVHDSPQHLTLVGLYLVHFASKGVYSITEAKLLDSQALKQHTTRLHGKGRVSSSFMRP
ncbi:hypothetical protein Pst134EA_032603 [Puccinia striiformis f. sp. tritici]|uniref:uncharacterized protein n=1 Tax=Puccinia striiformis f. sp. tritici TaxID=168172 RepID=UPI00200815FF|nr:uncharacterized protein Pst134EA_032603 [Puccinia striiformis f. sp. tritici]KAH9441698.1 hypothetical protein Pst134EA_032603 [Puccinia striiformis f. sp. tritici]